MESLKNGVLFLGTRALVAIPSGVSKFDFSDNFLSKNSAQIQNFTSWHYRGVNLVDCRVLCTERNSKRAIYNWRYKALISGMTDFAHLLTIISSWQTLNCKIYSVHNTLEVLTDHLLIKSQSAVFYSFRKLGHKITISPAICYNCGLRHRRKARSTTLLNLHHFTMSLLNFIKITSKTAEI